MSADPARHLKPVEDVALQVLNPESGEIVGPLEHYTGEADDALSALTHKYHAALAEITKLKRDRAGEARKHEKWAEAEALHEWWRLATGHLKTEFDADDFYAVLPRLKERRTPIDVLRAIAGIAFDPNTKRTRNGNTEVYDSWDLLLRSKANMDRYEQRAPGVPVSDTKWRVWLVERVEANFRD